MEATWCRRHTGLQNRELVRIHSNAKAVKPDYQRPETLSLKSHFFSSWLEDICYLLNRWIQCSKCADLIHSSNILMLLYTYTHNSWLPLHYDAPRPVIQVLSIWSSLNLPYEVWGGMWKTRTHVRTYKLIPPPYLKCNIIIYCLSPQIEPKNLCRMSSPWLFQWYYLYWKKKLLTSLLYYTIYMLNS